MDDNAMFKLTYGLFVLTARDGERDNGCIVNTVSQVASQPNTVAVAVSKANLTHDMIKNTGVFNVSVLTQSAKFETFKHWGFQSGRDTDKTAEIEFSRSENGLIYLTGETNSYISAKVFSSVDLGSHTLFLAKVADARLLNDEPSVSYDFYHKNIKPAPQKSKKKGFICKICGYIYEGDTLPEDFVCPWCKHPASDFEPAEIDG